MATIEQAQATIMFLRETYLHGRTASDSWDRAADLGAQAAEAASARQFERAARLFMLAAGDEYELTGDAKATSELLRAFDGSWTTDGKGIQLGHVIVRQTPPEAPDQSDAFQVTPVVCSFCGDAYDEKSGTCVRCYRGNE